MWNEWLARTLNPRRAEESEAAKVSRAPAFTVLPDFECDGMHPGADEFRSAMHRVEEESSPA